MTFTKRLLACLAIAVALPAAQAQTQPLSIATGGTGGVYYPLGGGMAQVLSKYAGMPATAEVTGGSVDNINLVGSGKPYVGFTMADAAWDAAQGQGKFANRKLDLRTLLVLYPNRMHVVTVDGTGIRSMKDLKGKRVSTGSAGSATEVMAFRILEAAGLDKDKDVKRERLSVAESVNAIKDRKIDAFFWSGGLPTAAVTDLANTPGTKIVMVDHAETVPAMNRKYGQLYVADTIPQAAYAGMSADNRMASVANILIAHASMSEQQAYNVVKTLMEKQPELVAVHKEAASMRPEAQKLAASPIPFHPGALKYFREKGIKVD